LDARAVADDCRVRTIPQRSREAASASPGSQDRYATSGSGDTLAGIIIGLLARGATPLQAAIWGVYLHGEAGNRLSLIHGHVGFLARELLDAIPRIMADLAPDGGPPR
jgi:NAD(P)H-hydrate repair Nnr-like enzyme with NAD(P)H-hydrate dehydratase domain